jgi:hypothetical protein
MKLTHTHQSLKFVIMSDDLKLVESSITTIEISMSNGVIENSFLFMHTSERTLSICTDNLPWPFTLPLPFVYDICLQDRQ